MKAMLGETGTEQFTVETQVDGKTIKIQPIHDPFIHTKIVTQLSWWACFLGLFIRRKRTIDTRVWVRGTEGAQRAIMMLDPEQLTRETEEILDARKIARVESEAAGGCCFYVIR